MSGLALQHRRSAGLADGGHSFRVRARDGAGNVDNTPATALWTIAPAAEPPPAPPPAPPEPAPSTPPAAPTAPPATPPPAPEPPASPPPASPPPATAPPATAPPAAPSAPTTAELAARATVTSRVLTVTRAGFAPVAISCAPARQCRGSATITVIAHRKLVVGGRASFSVTAGRGGTVRVRLTSAMRALVASRRRLAATVVLRWAATPTRVKTSSRRVTVRLGGGR